MASNIGVRDRLMEVFKQKLEIDVPSVDTDLMGTGLIDSLIFVELLFHIENEFGIAISMDKLELEYFRSVASIVQFIERREGASLDDFRRAFMTEADPHVAPPPQNERTSGNGAVHLE